MMNLYLCLQRKEYPIQSTDSNRLSPHQDQQRFVLIYDGDRPKGSIELIVFTIN